MQLTPTSDALLIQELAHEIWMAHYPQIIGMEQTEYMLGTMYSESRLRDQMQSGQQFLCIQDDAGAPIGFLAYRPVSDAPNTYFIDKFYIQSSRQGGGVGTKALQLLLERLPQDCTLRLQVNRQNYKSINFYFKNGFAIERCVDVAIGAGYEMNDFVMVRKG